MTKVECMQETYRHITKVRSYLERCINTLSIRAKNHDASKMQSPELEIFAEHTPAIADTAYGSEEYKAHLAAMKPALDHHYAESRHHPEHFKNGINDMNLIDLLEMVCDWKAASLQYPNGDIYRSIKINTERFGISDQLVQILTNTVRDLLTDYSYTGGKGISVTSEEEKDALTMDNVGPGDLVTVGGAKMYLVDTADDTGVTYTDLSDIASSGLSVRSVDNINELHALTANDVNLGDAIIVRANGSRVFLVIAVDDTGVQFQEL